MCLAPVQLLDMVITLQDRLSMERVCREPLTHGQGSLMWNDIDWVNGFDTSACFEDSLVILFTRDSRL